MRFEYNDNYIYLFDGEKKIGEILFPIFKNQIRVINRTYVDPDYRSGGLASKLVFEAYNYLKKNDIKVVATCPYVVKWFERHQDHQDILVLDEQQHLGEACAII